MVNHHQFWRLYIVVIALFFVQCYTTHVHCFQHTKNSQHQNHHHHHQQHIIRNVVLNRRRSSDLQSSASTNNDVPLPPTSSSLLAKTRKDKLLNLIKEVPPNAPSSRSLTDQILASTRELEECCPTDDNDVLMELAGNWELMWTAQDQSSIQGLQRPFSNWINPLENQSYSNNPQQNENSSTLGRANPILPRNIQERLEAFGLLVPSGNDNDNDNNNDDDDINNESSDTTTTTTTREPVRSSQLIDIKKSLVRNVVSFEAKAPPIPPLLPFLPFTKRGNRNVRGVSGSLIVDVKLITGNEDSRKVDVKFDSCRLILKDSKVDVKLPLGVIGPTGWLRTSFIDDTIRITRGNKGSVFILSRTAKK